MADTTSAAPSELGDAEDLYWRLHSLSKCFEGSSVCYDDDGEHYRTVLDAMNMIRAQSAPQPVAREPMPGVKPGSSFGGRPKHAMDIDPTDFYGITEAIHHALEALAEHEDSGTDWSPLDSKRSRRLRQALMAAWVLEYPQEATARGITGDKA